MIIVLCKKCNNLSKVRQITVLEHHEVFQTCKHLYIYQSRSKNNGGCCDKTNLKNRQDAIDKTNLRNSQDEIDKTNLKNSQDEIVNEKGSGCVLPRPLPKYTNGEILNA